MSLLAGGTRGVCCAASLGHRSLISPWEALLSLSTPWVRFQEEVCGPGQAVESLCLPASVSMQGHQLGNEVQPRMCVG